MHPQEAHPASCHCGDVRFEVDLPDGLIDPRHCNCSMCRRRRAIVATAPKASLRIIEGSDRVGVHQFNTKMATYFFCSRCGIYTHHRRRSNPAEFSFNVGFLEGIDSFEVEEAIVYDGVHHPREGAGGGSPLARRARQSVNPGAAISRSRQRPGASRPGRAERASR
ncbi:MAG: GFA family protein [Deltaproteobacteria bacterium]|nr:GFA family protein [Deltaproteobacteria bacterium]